MSRRVLIAGCGDLGGALARRLVRAGDRVFGLRRAPRRLPEGVVAIPADLRDPGLARRLPDALDAVVFAAAPSGGDVAAYREVYGEGLAGLLAALPRRPGQPLRFLHCSSTGVYGAEDGSWVDEETPPEPREARGRCLLAAERHALDAGLDATVLRLGGLYGPGRTRLLDAILRDPAAWMQEGIYGNRVHGDDAAALLHFLLDRPGAARILLGVDDRPASRAEVTRWVLAASGRALPEAAGDPAPARRGNKRCRNARLRALGFRLHYPDYRAGYGPLLEEAAARVDGEATRTRPP